MDLVSQPVVMNDKLTSCDKCLHIGRVIRLVGERAWRFVSRRQEYAT